MKRDLYKSNIWQLTVVIVKIVTLDTVITLVTEVTEVTVVTVVLVVNVLIVVTVVNNNFFLKHNLKYKKGEGPLIADPPLTSFTKKNHDFFLYL